MELDALALSLSTGRPLLIRGEAGIGKSQIARAAHAHLSKSGPEVWRFEYEVVTPGLEPRDLLWKTDPIGRLALAHRGAPEAEHARYERGVLWRALSPEAGAAANVVVLIDEIDKADPDLPNSLLEVLANGSFTGPERERIPASNVSAGRRLVIFTSNDERDLPPAFIRRCLILHLRPEEKQAPYVEWLLKRGAAQFPDVHKNVQTMAAQQTWKDRADTPVSASHRPGLAEFLDLLRGLDDLASGDADAQVRWLKRLAPYALLKAGQDQSRGLVDPEEPRPSP